MYTCRSLLPSHKLFGAFATADCREGDVQYVTTKVEMSLILLIRVSYFYSGVMSKIGKWTGLDY